MPYQVQKSKLIADLADLIEHKKAPLLGDVRDESAEDIRLVIEPKSRTVEPEVLMESLFKLSDLEIRFPINMNVLDATGTPRVMGLKACLQAFLDHRRAQNRGCSLFAGSCLHRHQGASTVTAPPIHHLDRFNGPSGIHLRHRPRLRSVGFWHNDLHIDRWNIGFLRQGCRLPFDDRRSKKQCQTDKGMDWVEVFH